MIWGKGENQTGQTSGWAGVSHWGSLTLGVKVLSVGVWDSGQEFQA